MPHGFTRFASKENHLAQKSVGTYVRFTTVIGDLGDYNQGISNCNASRFYQTCIKLYLVKSLTYGGIKAPFNIAFMPSISFFWIVISILSVALSSSFINAVNSPLEVVVIAISDKHVDQESRP